MDRGILAGVIEAALTLTAELANSCSGKSLVLPYLVSLGYDELLQLVEALPPYTADMEFYRNWARTSRDLWECGEGFAAGYQLTLMNRKLGQQLHDWS